MSIPGAKVPLPLARSNSVGPGITPGPGTAGRPPITPRPSTPSQRASQVGGPPTREGTPRPPSMSSVANRPRTMSLPGSMMRRDSLPAGEGGQQALGAQGQAGKPGAKPSAFNLLNQSSRPALARPAMGGMKPIGEGGGKTQATSAASETAETDSQISQLLDHIDDLTQNLREAHQKGAEKNDPHKLMEDLQKALDKLIELNDKRNAMMEKAGQSFAQAAAPQQQG